MMKVLPQVCSMAVVEAPEGPFDEGEVHQARQVQTVVEYKVGCTGPLWKGYEVALHPVHRTRRRSRPLFLTEYSLSTRLSSAFSIFTCN